MIRRGINVSEKRVGHGVIVRGGNGSNVDRIAPSHIAFIFSK
jgi:hypothetical protein